MGNWEHERRYWRDHYAVTPYYNNSADYAMYEPAYQYGVDIFNQHQGQDWDHLDQDRLRADWEKAHGNSTLSWDQAQNATRDAYMRLYNSRNHPQNAPGQR
jgi:hypothetical protein